MYFPLYFNNNLYFIFDIHFSIEEDQVFSKRKEKLNVYITSHEYGVRI